MYINALHWIQISTHCTTYIVRSVKVGSLLILYQLIKFYYGKHHNYYLNTT